MRCPKCDFSPYATGQPCPQCQFAGDAALIEELTHIKWMLHEAQTWPTLGVSLPNHELLQKKYVARQRELEVSLGLRLPPFTVTEAQQAWPEYFQRQALLQKMAEWLAAGLFKPGSTDKMTDQAHSQVQELQQQLEGHPEPTYPKTDAERLDLVDFLLEAVNYLSQNHSFTTPEAESP
jgi:hypothetical protein